MYDVKTDHTIRATAAGAMELIDGDEQPIVTAFTLHPHGPWVIQAANGTIPDTTAPDRSAAITAMIKHALEAIHGVGYDGPGFSTLVPHEMAALP